MQTTAEPPQDWVRRSSAIPPTARLTMVHVTECYGLVWVCLGTPVAAIPAMPYDGDARFRRLNTPVEVWRVVYPIAADNSIGPQIR